MPNNSIPPSFVEPDLSPQSSVTAGEQPGFTHYQSAIRGTDTRMFVFHLTEDTVTMPMQDSIGWECVLVKFAWEREENAA